MSPRPAAGAFNVLGGYMVGTGAISIFGAATQFLIMFVLGIPYALPLAVLAIFGGFIPYIGSLITTGLAFLVTVATGTPQDILIMGIFTIVFNIVQGNIVAPIVYSRVVSLHPAVVLVAIPAGNVDRRRHRDVPRGAVPGRRGRRVADRPARPRHRAGRGARDGADPRRTRRARRDGRADRRLTGHRTTRRVARERDPTASSIGSRAAPGPPARSSDAEGLRLGGRELLVGQDALRMELGQVLELGHLRIFGRRGGSRGRVLLRRRRGGCGSRLLLSA